MPQRKLSLCLTQACLSSLRICTCPQDARNVMFQHAAQVSPQASASAAAGVAVGASFNLAAAAQEVCGEEVRRAQAYAAGDGRAAAELSRKGREYGELAKQFRTAANNEVCA